MKKNKAYSITKLYIIYRMKNKKEKTMKGTKFLDQQISKKQMDLALLRSEGMIYSKQYAITQFRLDTLRREKKKIIKFVVYGQVEQ